ncbi:hypothetical protein ACFL1X_08880 [Candidatus Hydrogenedentota bacterium]
MGFKFKLGGLPPVMLDEEVLYSKKFIWLCSSKSPPTYRIGFGFPIPPLLTIALHVTDRRCRMVTHLLFGLVTQEFDAWYSGKAPDGDGEILTSVSTGKGYWDCPYLELVSHNEKRPWHWFCSEDVRIRFFFKNPENVENVIKEAMTADLEND